MRNRDAGVKLTKRGLKPAGEESRAAVPVWRVERSSLTSAKLLAGAALVLKRCGTGTFDGLDPAPDNIPEHIRVSVTFGWERASIVYVKWRVGC